MIIDSSVIVALALKEPEQRRFTEAMLDASVRRMSAGTWIELSAVAVRRGVIKAEWLDLLLDSHAIVIEPVTLEQAFIGHMAYRRFGLGTGHKAKLNFGDCFTYALAKVTGEPLLFKGDDFGHTDVVPVFSA